MFSLLIAFMVCTIPFQVVTMYENYKDRQIKVKRYTVLGECFIFSYVSEVL